MDISPIKQGKRMTKGLIVVVLAWTCQVALGSEITILEAKFQEGKAPPVWDLRNKAPIFNAFCFDNKLFLGDLPPHNLQRPKAVMENTPEGLSQRACAHQEFQIVAEGPNRNDARMALGFASRKGTLSPSIFKLCVFDVAFYYFIYSGEFVQTFEAGRAVACPASQPG